MIRVCIATRELYGFYKNGGIGTANFGIAKALKTTCEVTVVIAASGIDICQDLIKSYENEHGFQVRLLGRSEDVRPEQSNGERHLSYSLHKWLEKEVFDIVIADDYKAISYYPLMAKMCGIAHQFTNFITVVHGPLDWLLDIQEENLASIEQAITIDMERFVIQQADHTVYVSQYLKDYLSCVGYYNRMGCTSVIRYPGHAYEESFNEENKFYKEIKSIAFFGRQELRKGYALFLNVLKELERREIILDVHILGKFSKIHGNHSGLLADEILRGCRHKITLQTDLDAYECLEYLRDKSALVIIPSLADNLPNTVDECIAKKIPFITTSSGGQKELIHSDDLACHVTSPDPSSISDRIIDILDNNMNVCRPAISHHGVCQAWLDLISKLEPAAASKTMGILNPKGTALVTICIVHFNQAKLLTQTLQGLEKQTYKNIEVILVDDGSTSIDALALLKSIENNIGFGALQIKILKQNNKYLGRARNFALERAKGKYILFMDDDNFADERQVELLVQSMEFSGAAAITLLSAFNPLPTIPSIHQRWYVDNLPLGNGKLSSRIANTFGDANAIFDVNILRKSGGFFEHKGIPFEDWHCFTNIRSHGGKILVIPEILMFYRIRKKSMLRATPVLRALRHVIEGGYSESINLDEKWVQKYIYELSNKPFIDHQQQWKVYAKSLDSKHQDLILAINSEPDPNSLKALTDLTKYFHASNSSLRFEAPKYIKIKFPISKESTSIVEYKKGLAERLNTLAQLGSKENLSKYNSAIELGVFSIELSSLRFNETIFSTNLLIPGTDWPLTEIRHDGIFIHTVKNIETSLSIPNCIPLEYKYIVCTIRKLDSRAVHGRFKIKLYNHESKRACFSYKNNFIDASFISTTPVIDFSKNKSDTLKLILPISVDYRSRLINEDALSLCIIAEAIPDDSYGHFLISDISLVG